jgi:hypothetical protein
MFRFSRDIHQDSGDSHHDRQGVHDSTILRGNIELSFHLPRSTCPPVAMN